MIDHNQGITIIILPEIQFSKTWGRGRPLSKQNNWLKPYRQRTWMVQLLVKKNSIVWKSDIEIQSFTGTLTWKVLIDWKFHFGNCRLAGRWAWKNLIGRNPTLENPWLVEFPSWKNLITRNEDIQKNDDCSLNDGLLAQKNTQTPFRFFISSAL
jgi:hypothetical protein